MRDMRLNNPVGMGPATGMPPAVSLPPASSSPVTTTTAPTPGASDVVSVPKAATSEATPISLMGTDPPVKAAGSRSPHPKGTFAVSYGYNRAAYTHSDVRFKGEGYDFTLNNVAASDKPAFGGSLSQWAKEVLTTHPDIPQANYKLSYFVNDRTAISLTGDHMKYRMRPGQTVAVTGHVSPPAHGTAHGADGGAPEYADLFAQAQGDFAGTYNHTPMTVGQPGTIVSDLQHCDGLNAIQVDLSHYVPLAQSKNGKFAIEAFGSVGAGVYVTDTRANVFSMTADGSYDSGQSQESGHGFISAIGHDKKHTHAQFVVDGFGASVGAGFRATPFKY
ncbi:MAG: hypothetical protein H7338_12080, partial [Candidatus Sericytochromatia bacterium]|nr:hypothetical protein [Candidatus Sericytochromatia bacterium]